MYAGEPSAGAAPHSEGSVQGGDKEVPSEAEDDGVGSGRLWGGRFSGKTDPIMEMFNKSFPYDKIMYKEDIEVRLGVNLSTYRKGRYEYDKEQRKMYKLIFHPFPF